MACGCNGGSNSLWIPRTTVTLTAASTPTSPQWVFDDLVVDVRGYNYAIVQPYFYALTELDSGVLSQVDLVAQFATECDDRRFDNSGQAQTVQIGTSKLTGPQVGAAMSIDLFKSGTAYGPYMRPGLMLTASTGTPLVLATLELGLKLLRDP